MAGRPQLEIDEVFVDNQRALGYTWVDIAGQIGCSISTMKVWRSRVDYQDPWTKMVEGEELTDAIAQIVAGQPNCGSIMVSHVLMGQGMRAPRQIVRDTLRAIDPEASEKRKGPRIKRVVYDVVVPHQLWHHDGWHKLINFGIVVHGCVDGATRNIIYVEAADNNRAATVFEIFQRTRNHILPHRIRGDKGGENSMIRRFMNAIRPPPLIGYIRGKSVHNVPIERLWGHMKMQGTQFYRDFFEELTCDHFFPDNDGGDGIIVALDATDNDHIYVLHHMFIPMINDSLLTWQNGWNCHRIRTADNKSPAMMLAEREWYPQDVSEELVAAATVAAIGGAGAGAGAGVGDDDDAAADNAGDGNDGAQMHNESGDDEEMPGDDEEMPGDDEEMPGEEEFPELEDNGPWVPLLPRRCGLNEQQLAHFQDNVQPCRLLTHPKTDRGELKRVFFNALAFYYECKDYDFAA